MSRLVQPGLANSEQDFSVPCQRCAAQLYGRVKFCPYCGEDASLTFGASATDEIQEDVDAEPARFVPAPFEWQEVAPAHAVAPRPGAVLKRSAIGAVAALVLLVLALALGYLYVDKQHETDRSREFSAKLAQAQGALSRGDLSAAERALVVLVSAHPDHPGVQDLRNELDRRVREQDAKREQLREATQKAARVLGLAEPSPSPSPSPPPAPPAAQAPPIAAPAPEIGTADPGRSGCNDTLAALALCER
jgi:hypothetical protein